MITDKIDFAQVVLYCFWIFFAGLIFWLRREDRREGYPLEGDAHRRVGMIGSVLYPAPKTFLLPHGGSVQAPNYERDAREINSTRTSELAGAPSNPNGDPMLSNTGPASYAQRSEKIELTHAGHELIVPMRVAKDFSVSAGPDPRGWKVMAADGKEVGLVTDLWVDRADVMVRYLEVDVPGAGPRLIPVPMLRLLGEPKQVEVKSIKQAHFANVPALKEPDHITTMEEERITAYYAGGRLYADPSRLGPIL